MAAGLDGDVKIGLSMNTKSAEQSLSSFRKKLRDGFSGTDTKALDQSIKQTEKTVKQLETQIEKTKQKLRDLSTSDVQPKSVIAMEKELAQLEKQLAKADSEFEKLSKEQADLADRQVPGLTIEQSLNPEQLARFQELDNLIIKNGQDTEVLNARISELKAKLAEVKQNPQLTEEGKRYNKELDDATAEMDKQKAKLAELKQAQQEVANEASNTGTKLANGFNPVTKAINKIGSMIKRVFVFSVLTSGLRSLRTALGNVISQNTALQSSLNQIKGNLLTAFAPIWETVIPWLQTFMNVLAQVTAYIAQFVSMLFGKSISASKATAKALYNQANAAKAAGSASKGAAEDASAAAKETEKTLYSFDELNKLEDNSDAGSVADAGGASVSPFEPTDLQLSDEMEQKLQNIKELVELIGKAFVFWEVTKFVVQIETILNTLTTISGFSKIFSLAFIISGLGIFLDAWDDIKAAIKDIIENGPNFDNVTLLLQGLAKGLGAAFLALGKLKVAGVLLILSGVLGIIRAIKDIVKNGPNWNNVTQLLENLLYVAIGISAFTGHTGFMGGGLLLLALVKFIKLLHDNWDKIKQGDWSGVDKTELIKIALIALGGIISLIITFAKHLSSMKSLSPKSTKPLEDSVDTLDTKVNPLTQRLKSLAKNLGLAIVVIGEVIIACGLFIGGILGIGFLLKQLPEQWQPVIDNGETVATALGIGTILLGAVGTACYFLGKATTESGGTIAADIGIGAAVLLEIGGALALFLGEIWAIGWGLEQIGIQWQPVIDNGQTIATALGIGAGLLVIIGGVCGGLGALTVASGGTIAAAIGIGAAVLLEIGIATGVFLDNIYDVGYGLEQIGIQWQPVLDNGETVSTGIEKGSELLLAVGTACAALGTLAVASVGLLPLAIALGTKMLKKLGNSFKEFTDQVIVVAGQIKDKLHPKLKDIIDILPDTERYISKFAEFMEDVGDIIVDFQKDTKNFDKDVDKLVKNFKNDPIQKLADDVQKQKDQTDTLNDKLEKANPELETCIELITTYYGFLTKIEDLTCRHSNINLQQGMFTDMKKVGKNLILGFVDGMKAKYSTLDTEITTMFNKFTDYIDNDFKVNWKLSWDGIITAFKEKLGKMQTPMQDFLNHMIDGLNSVIRNANKTASNIGSITGKTYSTMSTFSHITIPPLAKGAVLKANKPFLAMVGDQKHGTNIEAPLATIQQAVAEVLNMRELSQLLKQLTEYTLQYIMKLGNTVISLLTDITQSIQKIIMYQAQSLQNSIISNANTSINTTPIFEQLLTRIVGIENLQHISHQLNLRQVDLIEGKIIPMSKEFMTAINAYENQKYNTLQALDNHLQNGISAMLSAIRSTSNGDTIVSLRLNEREFGNAVLKAAALEKARNGNSFVKTNVSFV